MAQRGSKVSLTVQVASDEREYVASAAEERHVSLAYIVREAIRLHRDFFSTGEHSTKPHILNGGGSK